MRKPEEHLAILERSVVGITQATLRAHTALWGQQLDALAAMQLERKRILRAPGAGAAVDPETRALMLKRVRDLELKIDGPLAECIAEVEGELTSRGITWRPLWYLGTAGLVDGEFWTADRANSINIPWYLANEQLWKAVNDVRVRYSRDDVMRVLRHEAAHALGYAFELWKRPDWQAVFGDFEQPYKDAYEPDPGSTDHVRYLHDAGPSQNSHYAQKHPDEDWAETFATWLDPAVDWRARYPEETGARAKLDYLERLVNVEGAVYGEAPNKAPGRQEPYTREPGRVGDFVGGWAQSDLWSPSSELLRREAWLETEVRLHSYYFTTLAGAGGPRPSKELAEALGGYREWEAEFRAVCASGAGWAATGYDASEHRTRTLLLAEGQGPPPGFQPALVVDLAEHAWWADFPGRKDLYVGAVLRNVDWEAVERMLRPR